MNYFGCVAMLHLFNFSQTVSWVTIALRNSALELSLDDDNVHYMIGLQLSEEK